MYTLLKPIQVREELLKRDLRIFTAAEFVRIFNVSSRSAKYFLEKQVDEGLLLRLKQGIYALKTDPPSEEEVANALYNPSYLSFEYALAYYHLLAEMPYTVTSATTKPTRLFAVSNTSYFYRSIKKQAFTGYALVKHEDRAFLIAEKEKALTDYLYFVILQKIPGNERLLFNLKDKGYFQIQGLDENKIRQYANLFDNKRLSSFVSSFL